MSTPAMPWTKYQAQPSEGQMPWEKYAQTQPGGQHFGAEGTPPPHEPNAVEKFQNAFDKATQIKPLDFSSYPKAFDTTIGNTGAGLMQLATPFVHPIKTAHALNSVLNPWNDEPNEFEGMFDPRKMNQPSPDDEPTGKKLLQMGGEMFALPGMVAGGELTGAGLGKIGEMIPSADRAGQTLENIRMAARDVPVTMDNASPELQRFQELTQRGGRGSKPFTQLAKRMSPGEEAINFPEARDFYSNIGDATSPTTLQKLMGRGMKPVMRRQGVLARRAMSTDLTNAADQVGMGQDYTNAMREYANAMKLRKYIRAAALLGAGEAARRTGLLGNWIHRTALQQ